MPEGDTIHMVARVMRPMVVDQPIHALTLRGRAVPLPPGARGTRCDAHGKHLFVGIAGGEPPRTLILRTHLGMNGSWHRYRPGEPWKRSGARAWVVIDTADWRIVCFTPKDVEVYGREADVAVGVLGQLGPDLLAEASDIEAMVARARARRGDGDVTTALLDQRVAAGIGNVYRNEVLFLAGVSPWRPLSATDDDTLRALFVSARALMQENVAHAGPRTVTTETFAGRAGAIPRELRHHVYRRSGRPCLACRTLVRSELHGPTVRQTYWCPACQSA